MSTDRGPIEVILFDLGNVILPFNHYQIAEKLSRYTANPSYRDPQRIFSYLFDFEHGAINDYEKGRITTDRFFNALKEELQLGLSFEEFAPIWNDIFWEDVEVSETIRALKGRKRLGLVSNTNPLHFDYILSKFPVVRELERWILSHEVGWKKPAKEIFQRAIEWAGVEPGRILFIDDMKTHVEAAISMGMKGIHFLSSDQLRKELSGMLDRG
ncbi:MAG: HAD family phosphatase [Desulfobacterota bacterium]|nr:HAD family phosphatase [Thermodesulfobacteriota bacterium]